MYEPWMADPLACLGRLAVQRVAEGFSQGEVAEFLGVSDRSIRRWFHPDLFVGAATAAVMLLLIERPIAAGRPCWDGILIYWLD